MPSERKNQSDLRHWSRLAHFTYRRIHIALEWIKSNVESRKDIKSMEVSHVISLAWCCWSSTCQTYQTSLIWFFPRIENWILHKVLSTCSFKVVVQWKRKKKRKTWSSFIWFDKYVDGSNFLICADIFEAGTWRICFAIEFIMPAAIRSQATAIARTWSKLNFSKCLCAKRNNKLMANLYVRPLQRSTLLRIN